MGFRKLQSMTEDAAAVCAAMENSSLVRVEGSPDDMAACFLVPTFPEEKNTIVLRGVVGITMQVFAQQLVSNGYVRPASRAVSEADVLRSPAFSRSLFLRLPPSQGACSGPPRAGVRVPLTPTTAQYPVIDVSVVPAVPGGLAEGWALLFQNEQVVQQAHLTLNNMTLQDQRPVATIEVGAEPTLQYLLHMVSLHAYNQQQDMLRQRAMAQQQQMGAAQGQVMLPPEASSWSQQQRNAYIFQQQQFYMQQQAQQQQQQQRGWNNKQNQRGANQPRGGRNQNRQARQQQAGQGGQQPETSDASKIVKASLQAVASPNMPSRGGQSQRKQVGKKEDKAAAAAPAGGEAKQGAGKQGQAQGQGGNYTFMRQSGSAAGSNGQQPPQGGRGASSGRQAGRGRGEGASTGSGRQQQGRGRGRGARGGQPGGQQQAYASGNGGSRRGAGSNAPAYSQSDFPALAGGNAAAPARRRQSSSGASSGGASSAAAAAVKAALAAEAPAPARKPSPSKPVKVVGLEAMRAARRAAKPAAAGVPTIRAELTGSVAAVVREEPRAGAPEENARVGQLKVTPSEVVQMPSPGSSGPVTRKSFKPSGGAGGTWATRAKAASSQPQGARPLSRAPAAKAVDADAAKGARIGSRKVGEKKGDAGEASAAASPKASSDSADSGSGEAPAVAKPAAKEPSVFSYAAALKKKTQAAS